MQAFSINFVGNLLSMCPSILVLLKSLQHMLFNYLKNNEY